YEMEGTDFLKEKAFESFFAENEHWLSAYAAFSVLRDRNGTANFSQWKTHSVYREDEVRRLTSPKSKGFKEIAFHYFVQYHLHLQLEEAADYAHKKGIALKGDIPIGVYRYGCDAWMAPQLYRMDMQAGAPPDHFAVKGQNWGFPIYNWKRMQEDGFDWWKKRFQQMSHYFDAFRIDHILGFFRIWAVPVESVEGVMGVFVPALPVPLQEFRDRGIAFDYDRFCTPFINDAVLQAEFGEHAGGVRERFLEENSRGGYRLLPDWNTQQKVAAYFEGEEGTESAALKQGLFNLISNVILFEDKEAAEQAFHFRISVEDTLSFRHLDHHTQGQLKELYIHYYYYRQDGFWKKEALRKLPALKDATHMLICGEDLGMVPHCVPDVMRDLGILSLEIQRMPKNPHTEFFHPKDAPYLSVVTPSTHDMSTVRGWWEEDRGRTQRFFNHILGEGGEAPAACAPWINRAVVLQHLYSPSMWSIFQLQDLLGMSETLRREDPRAERINDPANPQYYWNYRMHLTLEQLIREKEFNRELADYVGHSGRS
ncbi:MAG TPA: 4-alpha-glucanotransferase, partial [Chitinophagaceae bacterium]|nr:4-alpha-glucanotransferase [Chitinophagaceae bacterium]